ncbi:MAG: hypothetical protein M1822_010175 [Bathelium mastoideum]|nr:MAG: hypothetical protein M1822_010175 [Bathelium mastoideum]
MDMLFLAFLPTLFAVASAGSSVNVSNPDTIVSTDVITDIVVVTATVTAVPAVPTSQPDTWPYHSYGFITSVVSPVSSSVPVSQPVSKTVKTSPIANVATSSGSAASSPIPSSTSGNTTELSRFAELVVLHHNAHRANHSAPDLVWDQALADTAAKIAASCYYAHNNAVDGGGYGQNIAAGVLPANVSSAITDLFYNGEMNFYNDLYGEATPDMTLFDRWGHFSQVVWKATGSVGCAVQNCTSQGLGNVDDNVAPFFLVCNYKGPGNFGGEYGENVGRPLGHPSIDSDAYGLL